MPGKTIFISIIISGGATITVQWNIDLSGYLPLLFNKSIHNFKEQQTYDLTNICI